MVNIGNDWDRILEGEFEKEYYLKLREFLKKEYASRVIYPSMYDIFNALKTTPYENVKVVILGQDPYLSLIHIYVKHVEYEFRQADELELAYAMTVHKSQGSEFPVIVMPMAYFPPMLANRNLLYTGVTRGKQAVVLVGADRMMRAMIDNNRIDQRYSGLSEKLRKFLILENL